MEGNIKDLLVGWIKVVREREESKLDSRFLYGRNWLDPSVNYRDEEDWERSRRWGIEIKSCVLSMVSLKSLSDPT